MKKVRNMSAVRFVIKSDSRFGNAKTMTSKSYSYDQE